MKIQLLAIFAVLVFASVCSANWSIPAKNIEEFVLGFADGIEIQVNGNVTECVADSGVTFDDFEDAFEDLDNGFKNKSLSDIISGLKSLGAGVEEVSIVLTVCDVGPIAANITAIAKELMSGPEGILDVIIKEGINIFHHGHALTTDFKNAIAAWKAADYFTSGQAVGEITGVLLED